MRTIDDFQTWIWNWMQECFGTPEEVKKDRPMRFFEEALELVQATGLTKSQALELVDYVYDREAGEPFAEVGDVMLTLAGLASSRNISMDKSAYAVMERADKNRDKIIAKRKMRPTDGSALPVGE